ncbi:ArsR/SmtB family transcription factor [Parvularcula marina]|uniref:ArsR/SmtB family transcription factor n=2 Tax=Parvularcula marina TaxID=2292771 RepID=UPI00355A3CDA
MNIEDMQQSAGDAADFLRSLANEKRLMIVCQLISGEMSVGELCESLDVRQSTMSQQLALLRMEGIVKTRKEAQTVYYSLANDGARQVVAILHGMFCSENGAAKPARRKVGATA